MTYPINNSYTPVSGGIDATSWSTEPQSPAVGGGFVPVGQQYDVYSELSRIGDMLNGCYKGSRDAKKGLETLRDELVCVKTMALDLFEEAKSRDRSSALGSRGFGSEELQATVFQNKPGCCESFSALLLTIIAVTSITLLALCLVAACGGFPLLMTILNSCSLGAIVALPILASVSSTVATLSILATYMVLNSHSYRVELSRLPTANASNLHNMNNSACCS